MRITIEGKQGEGKSMVAALLRKQLMAQGFTVRVEDGDKCPMVGRPGYPTKIVGHVDLYVRQDGT